jgi:NTE family protein
VKPVAPSGLIHGQKVSLLLSRLTYSYGRVESFDNLPIPFRCVAVDLLTGKEVVLQRGPLAKALRATMSIPTIFTPVEWGDYLLIDGGLLNNLPVDVVRDMGADIVIAVNVGAPLRSREELQSILSILDQSINLPGHHREEQNLRRADIVISPGLKGFTAADFDPVKVRQLIDRGKAAARQSLPRLVELKQRYRLSRAENGSTARIAKANLHLFGISIVGNEKLPFEFIYRLFGFRPGDAFDPVKVDSRITDLYSLGYFETINYDIEPVDEHSVRLILNVKERPLRRLRIGLRYDDLHKLVAAVGLQTTNTLIPGLRIENELQFAGLIRYQFKAFYPSRTLDLPIYPYARIAYKNIPSNVFDTNGKKIATYQDRSATVGMGLGFLVTQLWNIEAEYNLEAMNIRPDVALRDTELFPSWKDRLRKTELSFSLDYLDNVLLPRKGVLIQAVFEGSFKRLGSAIEYSRTEISADFYHTLGRRHTGHVQAFWGYSTKEIPIYKYFYKGGPEDFVGVEYGQLNGNKLAFVRLDYRYEYKKDVFIKLIANATLNSQVRMNKGVLNPGAVVGYGIGVQFLSPVGPLQFIFSRGDRSTYSPGKKRNILYFTAGYRF